MRTSDINQQSLRATMNFLLDLIKNAAKYKYEDELKEALRTQGNLAKYSNEKKGIVSCSLNTLKVNAELAFIGGFNELDEKRKSALLALKCFEEKKTTYNKNTRHDLQQKIRELQLDINILEKRNLLLTSLAYEILNTFEHHAVTSKDPKLEDALSKIKAEFKSKVYLVENT